jgi:hypothetical protein
MGDHRPFLLKQFPGIAVQGGLQADQGGEQNINLSGLNLLDRSRIQVGRLGQLLLGQTLSSPDSLQALPKLDQIYIHDSISTPAWTSRHGPMGREMRLIRAYSQEEF